MANVKVQHSGRTRNRWIPDNAVEVKSDYAVVYVARFGERISAVGYIGNASRHTFYNAYRDMAQVDEKICEFFAGIESWKARTKQYRSDRYKPHTFKAGDVVSNSWGYDQTNVDWYRVVKTSAHFIWLQPIAGHTTEGEGCSPMAGLSSPHIDTTNPNPETWGFKDLNEPVERHQATGDNVTMKYGSGSKWRGEKKYESWYA